MRKLILIGVSAVSLAGCNPVNLTPQQQANLAAEVQIGKLVVNASANIICVVEPLTTKIDGYFDTTKSATTMNTKLDAATAELCAAAAMNL